MGDPKAFLNIPRQEAGYRPVNERIADYSQVEQTLNTNSRKLQASRCMAGCIIQGKMEGGIRSIVVYLRFSGIYGTYLSCPLREIVCVETFLRSAGDYSRE